MVDMYQKGKRTSESLTYRFCTKICQNHKNTWGNYKKADQQKGSRHEGSKPKGSKQKGSRQNGSNLRKGSEVFLAPAVLEMVSVSG